jgi:hypothetical protein
MSTPAEKPLPFQYQFAAGAVAGVSEVRYRILTAMSQQFTD